MEDHELLEMAAKAVGFEVLPNIEVLGEGVWISEKYRSIFSDERPEYLWNPLDDDGCAFRLAARLHISIEYGPITVASYKGYANGGNMVGAWSYEKHDHAKVARRAVVLAASEIGKAMP